MSLRSAARIIRKQTKSLIQSLFKIEQEYSTETFLDICERIEPSVFLVTGGALMEFFIMAFGSDNDPRLLFRYTSPRKRDRAQVIRSRTKIQYLMRQYTLRYFSDDLFKFSHITYSSLLDLSSSWK